MIRVFDARRKPIPLTLPEPLPLPSREDLIVMGRHRISLTEWGRMSLEDKAAARLSVAHTEQETT